MRVILAGGGTGGHIFPALALAQEFIEKDDKNSVLFVGSKKGLDKMIISKVLNFLNINLSISCNYFK